MRSHKNPYLDKTYPVRRPTKPHEIQQSTTKYVRYCAPVLIVYTIKTSMRESVLAKTSALRPNTQVRVHYYLLKPVRHLCR